VVSALFAMLAPRLPFGVSNKSPATRAKALNSSTEASRGFENPRDGLKKLRKNTLNEGHGFSRATNSLRSERALAPEVP
jgi:hypothetical protein